VASFRTFSEIVSSMLQRLKLVQPNLDTKPGTVSRDLFVDIQADQIERLYRSMAIVSEKQSLATSSGRDLDKIAANFGISRRSPTAASGIVVFTTNNISNDIVIPNGTMVRSRNGVSFKTINTYNMFSSQRNLYSANANRMKGALQVAGINDSYAIEIPVYAIRPGRAGNVSALQIASSNSEFNVKVVNLSSMTGGVNREADTSFRSRILAIFSGSNTGTANGYRNAAMGIGGVLDALVVQPGNTLMLRDGTETIDVSGGSQRILSSGTGGKVDLYVLGRSVQGVSESHIFTDLSGAGDVSDDRNDIILGVSGQDVTMTSEERRIKAFSSGSIPLQPIDSIISLVGSESGVLSEATIDEDGVVSGNYELVKDYNPETGGSPFGFDKIHFVSNRKEVIGESVVKKSLNDANSLKFSDIKDIDSVYRDVSISRENSSVNSQSRDTINLLHAPVVKVSRIVNQTTGETYVIKSQNIDTLTGLNESAKIQISGRSLPSTADVLSVDYTWRHVYDQYIDRTSELAINQFKDISITDSIDWISSTIIQMEESTVTATDDEIEYEVNTEYNISRVASVFFAEISEAVVTIVTDSSGADKVGIELSEYDDPLSNIISIKTENGLEIYNTKSADGDFSSKQIFLPTDAVADIGDPVIIHYNKVELYDIIDTDASASNNTITLPSSDILSAVDLSLIVENAYLSETPVYVTYSAEINTLLRQTPLSSLPALGSSGDNQLSDSSGSITINSHQPVFFGFSDAGVASSINRFGPTTIKCSLSGSRRPGKVKFTGTTVRRMEIDIVVGTALEGMKIDLLSYIKDELSISTIPDNIGVARVDRVSLMSGAESVKQDYDILGYSILDNKFDFERSISDVDLKSYNILLPSTPTNLGISTSSTDVVRVNFLMHTLNDFDEIYFPQDGRRETSKRFARVDRVSVSSGFRDSARNLSGSISLSSSNQPEAGETYFTDYKFSSPKEGERLTINYNINKLISDVTYGIESVRPITADILVKEASYLSIDVYGKILINDDSIQNTDSITQDVNNAVSNLLSSSNLGTTIDYSDILSVVTSVEGVDSATVSIFNESGESGRRSFIRALDNQSISAGVVIFEAVSRSKFRID
jgi:uncharacterized phage protein gp47/JayE|tara:strand:- start:11599 stop:14925 length:3327 start_codon:yes stop_codon:yes gene_type:complete